MIDSSLSKPSSFDGWFLDAAVCPWLETMLGVKPSMFLQARTLFSRNLRGRRETMVAAGFGLAVVVS